MRSLLAIIVLFSSAQAFAQEDRSAKSGPHSISVLGSFPRGGFSLGAGYEFTMEDSVGIEGHLRLFPRETTAGQQADGYLIVGGGPAYHFYKKSWDLAFNPSLNIMNVDPASATGKDATVLSPGLSVSLISQITKNVAVGFDWGNYWIWFDKDYAGHRISDLAVKLRMGF